MTRTANINIFEQHLPIKCQDEEEENGLHQAVNLIKAKDKEIIDSGNGYSTMLRATMIALELAAELIEAKKQVTTSNNSYSDEKLDNLITKVGQLNELIRHSCQEKAS